MIRLTRQQVREIDRRAIEEYHIPAIVLMENAARCVAEEAEKMLSASGFGTVLIVCGGGNNGGDGLAVARHLHNRQFRIEVLLAKPPAQLSGEAHVNWEIVDAMRIAQRSASAEAIANEPGDLVIDALFGTGLTAPPRAEEAALIHAINQRATPVLAVDLPSGLDCDRGEPLGTCVRAARTVTFVAEKVGFEKPRAKHYVGGVTVVDIGCPRELIEEVANSIK
jgi:NAD(P)H-hydrate epimerase